MALTVPNSWMTGGMVIWAIGLSMILATWMAPHALPLRAATMPVSNATTWTATHQLRIDCDCSAAVYQHLLDRRADPGWNEIVHLNRARPEWIAPLHKAGFHVEITSVRSGPRLVLTGPAGQFWQGGYAPRRPRRGLALEDLSIMQSFRVGRNLASMPAYGCASSNP